MANAKLIESAEKFVVVLERSGLFAKNQLEAIKKLAETEKNPLPIARTLVKKGWLSKWQASQLLSGFYNLTLGKYQLSDHLGKGELGNVYLAENPKLGRKVALKTLSKQHTESPDLVKRFIDEASAAAALDHRNIVHIHDVSSEGQRHYVVMEYVSGKDLQSRVDEQGELSVAEAVSVIRQAAEGLQHAHEQGVVHRDIKPANVMVDDQGVVKILDIGVGHLRRPDSNPSENTGELMMSAIAYMAPEHARGEDVDARSDIYSLGGVLYFLLTGRAPFLTKTDAERSKIKASKRPIPLSDLRADTPQPVIDLCERMTALKPDERFATMKEVLDALASAEKTPADSESSVAIVDALEAEPAELTEAEPEVIDIKEVIAEDKSDAKKSDSESTTAAPAIKIDLGDSAKPAAAAAPMDFAINTKKRKKKSAAKPAPAAKAAEAKTAEPEAASQDATASDGSPEPATPAPKKGLSKGLIIGGVCAAGLLLITGVGVGAMMLFRGGDTEVAQAATPPTKPEDDAGEPEDNAAEPVEGATESEPADASDATADDATAEDSLPSTDAAEPADDAASPAETDTAKAPATDAAEPAAGTDDVAAVEPAPAAAPADATQPPADPEMEKAEPPADAAAPAKPAEEKAAPEKKPAPKKKPPEKKAPPKPDTFVFAEAVDLPVPSVDAPELKLGQINIRPEDAVFISLDGGDIAAGGRFEFSLQNAQDGVAPRDWEFYLSDGSSDPVVIATMSMPEKDLNFKWTPAGVENATATNLRNCSLKITAGQDQPQDLALRVPQKVAPVSIVVDKPATAKLALEGAPDRSSLKMEVSVKGHKSMVEPAQVELGKGGEAVIYFGENRDQAALALRLDASINARGIQIKTEPYFLVPVEKSPVRLNKGSIKKYEAAQAQQAGLQNRIFEGSKAMNDNKLSPQQKAQAQAVVAGWKQQLELIDGTVAKMSQLTTDMAAIEAGASLHFRVFSDTFDKQIDLIITDPKAAPTAP